ncbi:MAG: hypothetical protein FWG31_07580 [Oscillospiraceae bacterium]|nr:hypothetical protein [Oscillospiraceae bacterium]
MPDGIGDALLRLLLNPVFAACGVVAFVAALTFWKGRKTQSKGMKAALIALFSLTAGFDLLIVGLAVYDSLAKSQA